MPSYAKRWAIASRHQHPKSPPIDSATDCPYLYAVSYSSYGGNRTRSRRNRRGGLCASTDHKQPKTWATRQGAEENLRKLQYPGSAYDWNLVVQLDYTDAELTALVRDAAPDLLAALKEWDRFMRANYTPADISWWRQTEQAIARAEGRSDLDALIDSLPPGEEEV